MTLREKQSLFARKIALLELVIIEMGYEITNGHALRCEDCHTGATLSLHKLKLAKDINLFKAGRYIVDEEGHKNIHAIWEMMGGAPMITGDPNHYSVWHDGRR